MSKAKRRRDSTSYNLHPEPETLEEVREALMTRMDIMERNLGRVIQRVLNEVNAMRKENEMLKAQIAKQTASEMPKINAEPSSDYSEYEPPKPKCRKKIKKEICYNSNRRDSKMSTFDDPLDETAPETEFEPDHNSMQFDPSTFQSFGCVLPKAPFTVVKEFEHFEELLENDAKFKALVIEFKGISCSQGDKYIRQCLRSLLTDQVAVHYTFHGTMTKKNFSVTKTMAAMRMAFTQKFGDFPEAFDKTVRSFFHYAKDRIIKLERYYRRRRAEETMKSVLV